MPIVRKLIGVGKTSKAVILPKGWLEFYEAESGKKIDAVTLEVNKVLIVAPLLREKPREEAGKTEGS